MNAPNQDNTADPWQYAWFKRSTGKQVTASALVRLPLGLFGIKHPNRYELRRRRTIYTPWESA